MLIANPIYDSVFKYLLEDNRVAILMISTIIDEEIESLDLRPQEKISVAEFKKREGKYPDIFFSVLRMDFSARIKTKQGEYKNVLIEIQKAQNNKDIMRFRKYLGEQYCKEDDVYDNGKKRKEALPIITIYFLGFELKNIEAQAVRVNRKYFDAITDKEIKKKNDFIEKLTHNSYLIQIPRLKKSRQNKLENLLSVFNQENQQEGDSHVLDFQEVIKGEELEIITKRLGNALLNKEVRDSLEVEEEAVEVLRKEERLRYEELEKKDNVIKKKDQIIEESKQILKDKNKMLEDKDKMLENKDRILEDKDKMIEELRRKLKER